MSDQTTSEVPLPSGIYKIIYVSGPSGDKALWAKDNSSVVIASNVNINSWLVKRVNADDAPADADGEPYTIRLGGKYWYGDTTSIIDNLKKTDVEVPVTLQDVQFEWLLVPVGDSEPGVYYIELRIEGLEEVILLVDVKHRHRDNHSVDTTDEGQLLVVKKMKKIGPDSPRWKFWKSL